jgi:prolyl 4-hydroxylase
MCCADIEQRIARKALLPVGNQEPLQVLLYKGEENGRYEGHYDYFFDRVSQENGGNRVATMLL